MTRKRHYGEGTVFSEWLREQDCIDSYKGYRTTNLDFIWAKFADNAKSEILAYMMIEEKTRCAYLAKNQTAMYRIIHENCISDRKYKGCYVLQFENESPEDGLIRICMIGRPFIEITKDQLLQFLKFEVDFLELATHKPE